MFSVELLSDLVQFQVRQTVSGVILAQMELFIQWLMMEMMRRDFNEHHMVQLPILENQLGAMDIMKKVSEHVGMNYLEIPDSRYVAQPVGVFLFPW